MDFPLNFIYSGSDYNTYEKHVSAPCFRRSFTLASKPKSAEIMICGLGFYELYINGEKITKGALAPYISNPDDIIYYDTYDIADRLVEGENVIGAVLGNGMQNAPGGKVWDFHLARYRGAPRLALGLEAELADGGEFYLESDESFRTAPSPIFFDDLRSGVFYDARREMNGWCCAGFDDSEWKNAIICEKPRGEALECEADAIVCSAEIAPVEIKKAHLADYEPTSHMQGIVPEYPLEHKDGWLYDFGVNTAGTYRLKINGRAGQRIDLQFCELIDDDGNPSYRNISFYPDGYSQRDIYICKGGEEVYEPSFTYHGYRYCVVLGLDDEQAKPELLTCRVMHSDIDSGRGDFECSDDVVNKIQQCARRSDLANFYYFPTDCPHREKNGWTGDASASCEHMLLNLSPERSYKEWLRNIRKTQREDGSLPGIIPTSGWGYHWGNGPTWDSVLTVLPYYTYIYRGDKEILKENAPSIFRYIDYISRIRDKHGLVKIGLGDWVPVGRGASNYKAPLEVTDTLMCMNICSHACKIFSVLGLDAQQAFTQRIYSELREAARKRFIAPDGVTVLGRCQTSQAAGLYFGLFDNSEKPAAARVLVQLIKEADNCFDVGFVGFRTILHVLADAGEAELAYDIIMHKGFPSYADWIARGATSLWESFWPEHTHVDSLNHHFLGDVSNFFITKLAGIRVNPFGEDASEVDLRPAFIKQLDFARAHYDTVSGRVEVEWKREGNNVKLRVDAADGVKGKIYAPAGYAFVSEKERDNDIYVVNLRSGEYTLRLK
ncbi:MAG: family 78 glycoside hydrolase catalytic domain [Clostridiales bacterium]|nr:family 78 glycoside hydrolase catalytic domain [Clostridiales bacterium]